MNYAPAQNIFSSKHRTPANMRRMQLRVYNTSGEEHTKWIGSKGYLPSSPNNCNETKS